MAKDVFPVWLHQDEVDSIRAIYEKTGALGSVVSKIISAESAKGTRASGE